ncbi:hypothetical protein KW476_15185 [Vibrio fluvialis]|nr:hypothetical protein [Vibrio fluvialis]MBY8105025.1 hypothetical protein [Vibrio fluvialis]
MDFSKQGRALTAQINQGVMRIYADCDNYRILGAEMCAPAAEHLAHLLALAIYRELQYMTCWLCRSTILFWKKG